MPEPFPSPTIPASSSAEVFGRHLDYFRARLSEKIEAMPPAELRRSRLPSGWTPLELVKHLRHVERRWLEWGFDGQELFSRTVPTACPAARASCLLAVRGGRLYAPQMGLIETLDYKIPAPNVAQRTMWHMSSSRPGAWLFARSLHHVDRRILQLSHGQRTLAGLTAGIPVLTVTTTGAKTGRPRSSPLIGVPFGGDIAIIGTRFGQPGTPGWYYNLRAEPRAEVTYRDRSVSATAREADEDQWPQIWAQARKIYAGYDAYARRITDRKIHIMILSAV